MFQYSGGRWFNVKEDAISCENNLNLEFYSLLNFNSTVIPFENCKGRFKLLLLKLNYFYLKIIKN